VKTQAEVDEFLEHLNWNTLVETGLEKLLKSYVDARLISKAHVEKTPYRFTKALEELFGGTKMRPEDVLSTLFPLEGRAEMIHIKEMTFFSNCAHHLVPFFGKATFAYIPKDNIVGLSKIPRLLEVFARRPQVQENLTTQVVDAFQRIVSPQGCGMMVRAYHMCCASRGIKQPTSYTETTAMRGVFENGTTKAEFIAACNNIKFKVF